MGILTILLVLLKACLHVESMSPFLGAAAFDLFDVMSKQHHGSALNSFLNGTKKKAVTLTVCVNEV